MNLLEQEKPLKAPFPDLPHWSENYCLASFDPKVGIGMWLHMGRWRKDLSMWRETVVLHMPDGTTIAHRAIGNAHTADDGPGGPCYAIRVLEHGRKLHYRFEGGARRVPSSELREGILRDGPMERVVFDLTFESDAGIWDLHKVGSSQDFLGKGHIEQIGRVTGTISVGGETFAYEGMGNRDHSMGPRDTPSLQSHQWLQGYFANGLSFLVYDAVLRGHDKPVFCECVVYEGNKLFDGKLIYNWRVDNADDAAKPYAFRIEYENGMLDIEAERIANTAYLSFTAPNDIYIGVFPAGSPPLTLLEQNVILRLNGDVAGYGNFERTVPGVIGRES